MLWVIGKVVHLNTVMLNYVGGIREHLGGRTMTDFNPGAEGLTTEELTLVETRLTNEAKSVLVAYILWIF